jgi:DNA-directed RNA polymerase subunit RPC12/RpoP
MKKSHQWQELVEVRCPHCGKVATYDDAGDISDIIKCCLCGQNFELGEQK